MSCTCYGGVPVFPMEPDPTRHDQDCPLWLLNQLLSLSRRVDALESARRVDELQAAVKA